MAMATAIHGHGHGHVGFGHMLGANVVEFGCSPRATRLRKHGVALLAEGIARVARLKLELPQRCSGDDGPIKLERGESTQKGGDGGMTKAMMPKPQVLQRGELHTRLTDAA